MDRHQIQSNTVSKSANRCFIQSIKYNQLYNYTDKSHAVINVIQCHLHAPHEITFIYRQCTTYKCIYTSYNIHINNNNNYTQIHRCATNDSIAQPTRLSAYSGLTSTWVTSDSPHSTQPIQFISEPRQFGMPRKLSHSQHNIQGSNFAFVTNNQPQCFHCPWYM